MWAKRDDTACARPGSLGQARDRGATGSTGRRVEASLPLGHCRRPTLPQASAFRRPPRASGVDLALTAPATVGNGHFPSWTSFTICRAGMVKPRTPGSGVGRRTWTPPRPGHPSPPVRRRPARPSPRGTYGGGSLPRDTRSAGATTCGKAAGDTSARLFDRAPHGRNLWSGPLQALHFMSYITLLRLSDCRRTARRHRAALADPPPPTPPCAPEAPADVRPPAPHGMQSASGSNRPGRPGRCAASGMRTVRAVGPRGRSARSATTTRIPPPHHDHAPARRRRRLAHGDIGPTGPARTRAPRGRRDRLSPTRRPLPCGRTGRPTAQPRAEPAVSRWPRPSGCRSFHRLVLLRGALPTGHHARGLPAAGSPGQGVLRRGRGPSRRALSRPMTTENDRERTPRALATRPRRRAREVATSAHRPRLQQAAPTSRSRPSTPEPPRSAKPGHGARPRSPRPRPTHLLAGQPSRL